MTTRKRNPVTGRYAPTAKTRAFKKLVEQRRADTAKAAREQRQATTAALGDILGRAQAAVARAEAAERAAEAAAAPTTGAAAPDAPGEPDSGAQPE